MMQQKETKRGHKALNETFSWIKNEIFLLRQSFTKLCFFKNLWLGPEGLKAGNHPGRTFHRNKSFTLSGNYKRVIKILVHGRFSTQTRYLFSGTPAAACVKHPELLIINDGPSECRLSCTLGWGVAASYLWRSICVQGWSGLRGISARLLELPINEPDAVFTAAPGTSRRCADRN